MALLVKKLHLYKSMYHVAMFHTNAIYGHRCYHEIIFFEENFLNLVISCNEKKIKFVGLKLTQLEILQNPEMQKIILIY